MKIINIASKDSLRPLTSVKLRLRQSYKDSNIISATFYRYRLHGEQLADSINMFKLSFHSPSYETAHTGEQYTTPKNLALEPTNDAWQADPLEAIYEAMDYAKTKGIAWHNVCAEINKRKEANIDSRLNEHVARLRAKMKM